MGKASTIEGILWVYLVIIEYLISYIRVSVSSRIIAQIIAKSSHLRVFGRIKQDYPENI